MASTKPAYPASGIALVLTTCLELATATTSMSPLVTTSQGEPSGGGGVWQYMASHVWVPVLIGIAFIAAVALVIYGVLKLRHRSRYDYTALNEDLAIPEKLERAQKKEKEHDRDIALLNCSFYLRSSGNYTLVDHLPDIGSRVKKNWFWVRHNQHRTEHMLTMAPKSTVHVDSVSQRAITDLLALLKHPYLAKIQDVDCLAMQDSVSVIQPYCRGGSLKDVIHGSRCTDEMLDKYLFRGKRLPVSQIQLFGRQILEALLYLEDKGFPKYCHLHSGNIMVQDFTCRITGYENVLLGYNFKLQPVLKKKLKDNFKAVDSLCFGHVIFEMATGYDLDSAHPGAKHMANITDTGVADVLNFIFENSKGYPSILDIYQMEFFQVVHLKEMETYNDTAERLPSHVKTLLKSLRRSQRGHKKNGKSKKPDGKDQTTATVKMEVELQPRTNKPKPAPKPDMTLKEPVSSRPNTSQNATNTQSGSAQRKSTSKGRKSSRATSPREPSAKETVNEPEVKVHIPAPSGGKSALLSDIRKGITLKKTATVDKSQPRI